MTHPAEFNCGSKYETTIFHITTAVEFLRRQTVSDVQSRLA